MKPKATEKTGKNMTKTRIETTSSKPNMETTGKTPRNAKIYSGRDRQSTTI